MKIIVVKGNPNSGKTTSIRLVYDLLLYMGAEIAVARTSEKPHTDFDAELLYDEKRIAISSAGDVLKNMRKTIANYKEHNSDILIMASRNFKPSSLDELFFGHEVKYICKEIRGDKENIATAQEVLQYI